MWNLKYSKNVLIYETETDSQTQKTNLWLPKEKGGQNRDKLGLWDQKIQITVHKIDKKQGPTVQQKLTTL